ncbi:MAG: hypothetical protein J6C87_02175 [Bacteroides sp.]|nr:hypothetical protein [Bacteroides sp.]
MIMKSYKISYYVLYVMFAAIIAVLALFFMGGDAQGDAVLPLDPSIWQPAQTDTLLYLMYILGAVAILVTLIAGVVKFGASLKENPVAALKSLSGLILLVAVFVITWVMGSDEVLNITGYEGTQNVPFWLKATDMFLYTTYILTVGTLVAMLFGAIKKKLS